MTTRPPRPDPVPLASRRIPVPADDDLAQAIVDVIHLGKVILARLDRLEAAVGLPPFVPPVDPPPDATSPSNRP